MTPVPHTKRLPGIVFDSMADPRHMLKWVMAVAAFALLLRFALYFIFYDSWTWQTGHVHDNWNLFGMSFARIGKVGFGDGQSTLQRTVTFPAVIALVYYAVGENYPLWSAFFCLFDVGTCVLAVYVIRNAWGQRVGVLAGLYLAAHLPVAYYTAQIEQFTVLLPFLVLWIWLMTLWERKPTSIAIPVGLGLVTGWLILSKSVYLLFPPVSIVALALVRRRQLPWRRFLLGAAVFMFLSAAVVAPWTIRNYRVSGGKFIPVQTLLWENVLVNINWDHLDRTQGTDRPPGSLQDYIYARRADILNASPEPPQHEWALPRIEAHSEAIFRDVFFEWIPDNVGVFAAGVAKNVWQFWVGAENGVKTRKFIVLQFVPLTLAIFGLVVILRRRKLAAVWMAGIPIVMLWSQYSVVHAMGRYSLSLVPALALLFAYGADLVLKDRLPSVGADTPLREP